MARRLLLALAALLTVAGPWAEGAAQAGARPKQLFFDADEAAWGSIGRFKTHRRNLVVAVVGEGWQAKRWGFEPQLANFDIFAIYHGRFGKLSCPSCTHVVHLPGAKWQNIHKLTQSAFWEDIRRRYSYVMFPDEDLQMDVCTINAAFDVMTAHQLALAQPSICKRPGSRAADPLLFQKLGSRLRHVNMVDPAAPMFEMQFFDEKVAPTLKGAYLGLGLEWCFPWLLDFAEKRVAVIDTVCVGHPAPTPQQLERRQHCLRRPPPFTANCDRCWEEPRFVWCRECLRDHTPPRCRGTHYWAFGQFAPYTQLEQERQHNLQACGYTQANLERAGLPWAQAAEQGWVKPNQQDQVQRVVDARLQACQAGNATRPAIVRLTREGGQQTSLAAAMGRMPRPSLLALLMLPPAVLSAAQLIAWALERGWCGGRQQRRGPSK